MTAFILLLAMWPFHAEKPSLESSSVPQCEKAGDFYFYAEDDKFHRHLFYVVRGGIPPAAIAKPSQTRYYTTSRPLHK
jgi:hypothetical protein